MNSNTGAIPRTSNGGGGGGISNPAATGGAALTTGGGGGASTSARGYSSFTESAGSDQDGNSAVVSLNGTQLVMNNKARSRAPLPGFSSFV